MKKPKLLVSFVCMMLAIFGAVALSHASMGEASAAVLPAPTQSSLKVDTLGYLYWNAVTDVEYYEWKHDNSNWIVSEQTEVDVAEVLQGAIKQAKSNGNSSASVTFKVRAVNNEGAGAEATLVHTFSQYIDFGFAQQDIADVYGVLKDGGSVTWATTKIHSAVARNEILTFGALFSGDTAYSLASFNILSSGDSTSETEHNYNLKFIKSGVMYLYTKNGSEDRFEAKNGATVTPFADNVVNYFSFGALETFNIAGEYVGDSVYVKRSYLAEGAVKDVIRYTRFVPKATTDTLSYTNTATLPSASLRELPNTTATILAPGAMQSYLRLVSGKPQNQIASPSYVYYNNEIGYMGWNKVEQAVGYQWAYGLGDWQYTTSDSVEIASFAEEYIANYATSGVSALRFRVRAVDASGNYSHTASYNLNLKAFYNRRSSVRDISTIHTTRFATPLAEEVQETDGGTLGTGTGLSTNSYIEMAFRATKETYGGTPGMYMLLFGANKDDATNPKNYMFTIYPDGTVLIGQGSFNSITYSTQGISFTRHKILNKLDINKKYFATYGADELFDIESGAKVADRLTIKISVEEGSYRKVLIVATYDNYQFANKEITHDYGEFNFVRFRYDNGYNVAENKAMFRIMSSRFNRSYTIVPLVNGNPFLNRTQTVGFGQKYNFISAFDIEGYIIEGWYLDEEFTQPFELIGHWNVDIDPVDGTRMGIVYANAQAIEYNVTYNFGALQGVVSNPAVNQSVYTVEDEFTLAQPTNLPNGKVFKGWYLDGEYQQKVEAIANQSGDIVLYAKFVDGWSVDISFDGVLQQSINWEQGDAEIELLPMEITGKGFVKWQVYSGNAWQDYAGEATFVPQTSMRINAVYSLIQYTITYNADGEHTNTALTYNIENHVEFVGAVREGWFFCGWYTDAEYTNLITSTEGLLQNLTLYARFYKDNIPSQLTYYQSPTIQMLPVPELPAGSQYTIELYKGEEQLDIIENLYYPFNTQGTYTFKLFITLVGGEQLQREIEITVAGTPSITVNGTYNLSYQAGQSLTLHSASVASGNVRIDVAKNGEVISVLGNEIVLEAGSYSITYIDESGIAQSVVFEFEVQNAKKGGCGGASATDIGGFLVVLAGAMLVLAFIKRASKRYAYSH